MVWSWFYKLQTNETGYSYHTAVCVSISSTILPLSCISCFMITIFESSEVESSPTSIWHGPPVTPPTVSATSSLPLAQRPPIPASLTVGHRTSRDSLFQCSLESYQTCLFHASETRPSHVKGCLTTCCWKLELCLPGTGSVTSHPLPSSPEGSGMMSPTSVSRILHSFPVIWQKSLWPHLKGFSALPAWEPTDDDLMVMMVMLSVALFWKKVSIRKSYITFDKLTNIYTFSYV